MKRLLRSVFTLMILGLLFELNLDAAPETITIQHKAKEAEVEVFQAELASMPVDQIADPAVRDSLKAIRDYLNPSKKKARVRSVKLRNETARGGNFGG